MIEFSDDDEKKKYQDAYEKYLNHAYNYGDNLGVFYENIMKKPKSKKDKTLLYSRIQTFHPAELHLLLSHKFDYISLIPPKIASFYSTRFAMLSSPEGRKQVQKQQGYLSALFFSALGDYNGDKMIPLKLCHKLGAECSRQMMVFNN